MSETVSTSIDQEQYMILQEQIYERLGLYSNESRLAFIASDSRNSLRADLTELLTSQVNEADIVEKLAEKYQDWDKNS